MTAITLADLTTSDPAGPGVFDALMRSMRAHLEVEFKANRIKGTEYATVYLGALSPILNASLQFVINRQKVGLEASLLQTQIDNAVLQGLSIPLEGAVLTGQKCKLDAEFDILLLQKLNTATENALLSQKIATEKAQTTALGVDDDSVVGKQKRLYQAQTDGFARDAEQKAAKLLVDTWNVRRTTDGGTVADSTNKLDDATVGRLVAKVLAGVGA